MELPWFILTKNINRLLLYIIRQKQSLRILFVKFKIVHNAAGRWAEETASPFLGMLNAGLQLYWLKYNKPHSFSKMKYSVFLPQYLSFLFSSILVSEYTGIGCHTGMMDFQHNDFHDWMYQEGLVELLPPICSDKTFLMPGKSSEISLGIHDSSAALWPYISGSKEPFILLSTGTWSICLNPFNDTSLTKDELKQDCLCYMQADGQKVKASRLFMGNEYNNWINKLSLHFGVDDTYHKKVVFDKALYQKAKNTSSTLVYWTSIDHSDNEIAKMANMDLSWFDSFEEGYHHLMKELVQLQVDKIQLVITGADVKKICIDGGFVDNNFFLNILSEKLSSFEILPSLMPLGSAMGAVLALKRHHLSELFLQTEPGN